MVTKALVKKLNSVFRTYKSPDKKYSEIWLSEADFGGINLRRKFILNVKAEHHIDSCFDEIGEIANLLREHAKEELDYLLCVTVYTVKEEAYCEPLAGEILVYSEEESC